MKIEPAELLKDALALPPEARSALVESLLESLDPEVDDDVHEPWRTEIKHRLHQIDAGAVDMMPWDNARRFLRGRLQH